MYNIENFNGYPIAQIIGIVYCITLNFIGIYIIGRDKGYAVNNKWRIKESTIFKVAYFGGALGVLIGMYRYRHKTKTKKFVVGIPIICILNFVSYIVYFYLIHIVGLEFIGLN